MASDLATLEEKSSSVDKKLKDVTEMMGEQSAEAEGRIDAVAAKVSEKSAEAMEKIEALTEQQAAKDEKIDKKKAADQVDRGAACGGGFAKTTDKMKAKIAAAIEKDAKVAAFKQSLYDIVANPDDNVDLIIKDLDKHCMPRPGDVMVYKKDSTLRQTRA